MQPRLSLSLSHSLSLSRSRPVTLCPTSTTTSPSLLTSPCFLYVYIIRAHFLCIYNIYTFYTFIYVSIYILYFIHIAHPFLPRPSPPLLDSQMTSERALLRIFYQTLHFVLAAPPLLSSLVVYISSLRSRSVPYFHTLTGKNEEKLTPALSLLTLERTRAP